jgi:hypothetical protein
VFVESGRLVNVAMLTSKPPPVGYWRLVTGAELAEYERSDFDFFTRGVPF